MEKKTQPPSTVYKAPCQLLRELSCQLSVLILQSHPSVHQAPGILVITLFLEHIKSVPTGGSFHLIPTKMNCGSLTGGPRGPRAPLSPGIPGSPLEPLWPSMPGLPLDPGGPGCPYRKQNYRWVFLQEYKDWRQEEKGTTEDEMAGWHHQLDGREFEWTLGFGDGQGGLACCDSWGRKELDMTERLNWTELIVTKRLCNMDTQIMAFMTHMLFSFVNLPFPPTNTM